MYSKERILLTFQIIGYSDIKNYFWFFQQYYEYILCILKTGTQQLYEMNLQGFVTMLKNDLRYDEMKTSKKSSNESYLIHFNKMYGNSFIFDR